MVRVIKHMCNSIGKVHPTLDVKCIMQEKDCYRLSNLKLPHDANIIDWIAGDVQ